jgi:hypothetical protein
MIVAAAVLATSTSALAITRRAPTWSFTEISVSGTVPMGEYEGLPTLDFNETPPFGVWDGDDLLDPSFAIGVGFGQVRSGRLAYSIAFRYTSHNLAAQPWVSNDQTLEITTSTGVDMQQWDIEGNVNLYIISQMQSALTPYVGLGLHAGITQVDYAGFDDESDGNVALSLNFGVDFRLSPMSARSYWALASVNHWDFVRSGDRPKYLYFGGAIKYYFKGF